MDPDDIRSIVRSAGVDICTLIDAAVSLAVKDCPDELKLRRDGLVEMLYSKPEVTVGPCLKCEERNRSSLSPGARRVVSRSPPTPESMNKVEEEDELEEGGMSDGEDATRKILAIKKLLEDDDQSEERVVGLLEDLADVDVTFKSLQETDIGRHVNKFRKHPSSEVQRLVKLIVRKWKAFVDNWVKMNSAGENENISPANNTDGDSPMQNHGNGHRTPDSSYSPVPHNGGSDNVENKAKAVVVASRREPVAPPPRRNQSTPTSAPQAVHKDAMADPERLASARKRLQDNYQEAQNARKQRTIQVMDIHEIPKPKVGRSRGGSSHQQTRQW